MGRDVKERMAVYPGTFDPVTNGHLDVIKRGARLFDRLIVAVARNPDKSPLFTVEERIRMIKELTKDMPNVCVEHFNGLTVEFCRSKGACPSSAASEHSAISNTSSRWH